MNLIAIVVAVWLLVSLGFLLGWIARVKVERANRNLP